MRSRPGAAARARIPLVVGGGVSANLPLASLGPPLSRSLPGQEGNAGGPGWVSKSRNFRSESPASPSLVEMSQMFVRGLSSSFKRGPRTPSKCHFATFFWPCVRPQPAPPLRRSPSGDLAAPASPSRPLPRQRVWLERRRGDRDDKKKRADRSRASGMAHTAYRRMNYPRISQMAVSQK